MNEEDEVRNPPHSMKKDESLKSELKNIREPRMLEIDKRSSI